MRLSFLTIIAGAETIQESVLSYMSPTLRAQAGMVAEIVQYFDDALKIRPIKADSHVRRYYGRYQQLPYEDGCQDLRDVTTLEGTGADVIRIRKMSETRWNVRATSPGDSQCEDLRAIFTRSLYVEQRSEGVRQSYALRQQMSFCPLSE